MTNLVARRALILFTRAPEFGKVKTRLQAELGAAAALDIHIRLLSHALQTIATLENCKLILCVAGELENAALWNLMAPFPCLELQPQTEGDLGERMACAFQAALTEADEVVLIGSDCPAIDASYLQQAFARLADYPVVIGPAIDGGYVLIALRAGSTADQARDMPDIFTAMPWSESHLLHATRERMQTLGVEWFELPTLADVDHPADVPAAMAIMASGKNA